MIDPLKQYKENNVEKELELILQQIKSLTDRMDANFKEIYQKLDVITDREAGLKTQLEVLRSQFQEHERDEKASLKAQGERIGAIEKNPVLQSGDRWKWLLGIIGALYLALQFSQALGLFK